MELRIIAPPTKFVGMETNATVRNLLHRASRLEQQVQLYLRDQNRVLNVDQDTLDEIRSRDCEMQDIEIYEKLERAAKKLLIKNDIEVSTKTVFSLIDFFKKELVEAPLGLERAPSTILVPVVHLS